MMDEASSLDDMLEPAEPLEGEQDFALRLFVRYGHAPIFLSFVPHGFVTTRAMMISPEHMVLCDESNWAGRGPNPALEPFGHALAQVQGDVLVERRDVETRTRVHIEHDIVRLLWPMQARDARVRSAVVSRWMGHKPVREGAPSTATA